MINKILGYVLLVVGLMIIGSALWQSYNIFTAKTAAPLIFTTPAQAEQTAKTQNTQDQLKQLLGLAAQQQINQTLPPDAITKIFNLLSWSLLAFILVLGGGAISGIGVKLINGKN